MTADLLSTLDFTRATEPSPALGMRDLLIGWLDYQRHEFLRKLRDLSPEEMPSAPSSAARGGSSLDVELETAVVVVSVTVVPVTPDVSSPETAGSAVIGVIER